MKLLLMLLDYVFLTRPILIFPGWATLLAGYFLGLDRQSMGWTFFKGWLLWNNFLILLIIAFGAAMGGCFILNQLRDVETDRKNNKLFLLGNHLIPIAHGYVEGILLLLLSLWISIQLNTEVFTVMLVFIIVTGYLYNYNPFIFKSYPIRGLIANMAMGWLAFAAGWVLAAPFNKDLFIISLPYLLYNTALYFLTTLPDMKGDAATDKITFPVRYGISNTIWLSSGMVVAAMGLCVLTGDFFLLIVSGIVLPFFIRLIRRQDNAAAIIAIKMGLFVFAMGVSVKFPLFAVMIGTAYLITRFYYKKRFGFDYPSFKGA